MAESFTNQAREQAESKSSFFKREKILGEFRTRRSNITGSKFKKGTSQQSVDNIEKRVGINEKKITLLKKVGNLRKDNQKEKVNSPLLESLQAIASTVGSIRDTLIQQQDNDKSVAESMRREKEEKERKDQEKGLEAPKPLQKMADKVIAPVMSLWSKILKFITTIFLGKILMNFLDWFGNPENQGKITTLIRFVKDWWPALVGAVLLFGTGFGGLVTGLTVAIATFIPKMLAAITALKASKLAGLGGKAGLIKGGLLVGAGVLAGMGISKMMDKGDGEDVSKEKVQGLNKGGQVRGSGNKDTVPAMLTPGEFVMSKGAVQQYGVDTMESMNAAAGGTNRPTVMRGFNEGGVVTDPEVKKRQEEYMLKFVNEERAFQGLPPLDNLTYAPGVELTKMRGPGPRTKETSDTNFDFDRGIKTTSKTRTVDGKTSFSAGISQTTEKDREKFFAENPHAAQLVNLKNQAELDNLGADISASAKMNGGGLVQGFQGGGIVLGQTPMQRINELRNERREILRRQVDGKWATPDDKKKYKELTAQINELGKKINAPQKSTPTSKVTPKKSGGGLFGGLFGGGKKEGGSSGILGPISSNVDDMVDTEGYEKPAITKSKSGGSSGILGPISSNIDAMVNTDKYEVKPKEKKNVVVAYNQEASKEQKQKDAPPPGGNDIPAFDVRPPFMTDQDKMMVLGMRV